MENVRYQLATTMRKNKGSSYETTAGIVNAAASGRQAPSAGNYENYHSGRRQRSRRRDVYAAPDDFVRVSTLSPPVATVVDTVRRQVDISDVHAKSPPLWAQPTFATGSGTATRARSRSRPRPPFLLERGVQRGEMPSDYVRDLVDNSRLQQQQLTEQSHQRQRHHQRQQHQQQQYHGAGLKPSVEFSARCAVDSRPQVRPNPISLLSDRTVTSPIPAPLSPSYVNDNKSLLKEAIISAAAAKLARSSSARSAVVKPLVVIRNGPYKSSSDEHIDADDDVTTMTVKSPVSSDRPESPATVEHPEHTADIAVAAAAAAAAAATRRSRTRRRDADQVTSSGVTASSVVGLSRTNVADSAGTRRTRAVNRDAAGGDIVSQSDVAVSLASGVKMQDAAGTRPVNSGGLLSAAQSSLSSNCGHAHDARRPATLTSTPGTVAAGTTYASETLSKTKKVGSTTNDNRKDLRQSTTDAVKMELDIQRVDKTINDNNVTGAKTTSVVTDAETRQESPSSIPKVSFIKSILSRTHSPSPSRCRRSRSKVLHASPSPSSVKRISAEVAQRISEPVKGYLKQLRDRSSQRRRPTEPATTSTMKTGDEPEPSACQDCEIASVVNSQPKPSDTSLSSGLTASSDDRSTDDMSTRGRSFRTDRQKQENGTSSLTSQWKSTSALTTPMSRLDNLLKANSLQHLQTSTTAAFRKNGPLVDETSGTPSSTSSAPPLLSKTSQSTGCLLSSPSRSSDTQLQQSIEHQRSTTMSRCYLEKPPRAARAARRAMTVQLGPVDRQSPSLSVTERQSTSQADLRNSQPAAIEEPDDSSKLTKDDVRKESADETTSEKTAVASTSSVSHSQKLHTANHASPSQNERDLRELYEQKRLERQLEEKLAAMEKERADMIAKLWSQIDRRREANTTAQQRTTAVGDHVRDSSSSSGIVLPLSSNTASPAENNNQVVSDPLGDLLIELSSTPTTRWTERRRSGRTTTAMLRPRAASCSRRLTSDNTPAAAAAAAGLTSKSLSHIQLHRNPSNCSELSRSDTSSVQLRNSSQQQLQPASARPLTCYLPVRDGNLDLRRFIETAGHHLDQCGHVQLTSSTCHGYLSKLSAGATVRQWKRRWFVFDRTQRCLHYYADKTEKRAEGAFIWFQMIQDVFVDHERRSRSPRPEATFCVKTVERPLFLMAPTPETMRIWIDVIFTGAEGYQQFPQQ